MIRAGSWLGIDVGSSRDKVCSFCWIESPGAGRITVSFEQGPAQDPYPRINSREALLGPPGPPWRRPTYLRPEIDAEIGKILDRAETVGGWLQQSLGQPSAAAVDAPVAFATEAPCRRTEQKSTDTFKTPTRETFETQLGEKGDPFLRVNSFWKCVGLAVYRHLATRLDATRADFELPALAALTCSLSSDSGRLRETFPSDVYKRANGHQAKGQTAGILSPEARKVLHSLVGKTVAWRSLGREPGYCPTPQTLKRLDGFRQRLRQELKGGKDLPLQEMHKRPGRAGDLWDAFTCAFTACCEDHGAGLLHGWSDDPEDQKRLRAEGAILTVTKLTAA